MPLFLPMAPAVLNLSLSEPLPLSLPRYLLLQPIFFATLTFVAHDLDRINERLLFLRLRQNFHLLRSCKTIQILSSCSAHHSLRASLPTLRLARVEFVRRIYRLYGPASEVGRSQVHYAVSRGLTRSPDKPQLVHLPGAASTWHAFHWC